MAKKFQRNKWLKWLKWGVSVLLLPVCFGEARALVRILAETGGMDTFWVGILTGAACWLAIYLLLPKPMRIYVLGHELTHALWTWLFGGRVKQFKASATSGRVVITKSNFLIELAPYFFPLYAVLVAIAFGVVDQFWDWTRYRVFFHLCLGGAYAFHVSLTWHILSDRQPDIVRQGYIFSAVIIVLGNLTVLLISVPLLAGKPDLSDAFRWWGTNTAEAFQWLAGLVRGNW